MAHTDSYSNRHVPRSATNRAIAGVCGGLAEHFDVSVTWLRIGFLASLVFTSGLSALFYVACIFIMPRADGQPRSRRTRRHKQAPPRPFYRTREEAMDDLNDQFNTIEHRIRTLEDLVTSREYVLKRKFDEL